MVARRLLGQDVDDEIQAQGRIAAGHDRPTAGRPSAEGLTALKASMMRLAASRRRASTSVGVSQRLIGLDIENAGPNANTSPTVVRTTRPRIHATFCSLANDDVVVGLAFDGVRPLRSSTAPSIGISIDV